jgi:hypothetical protein
MSSRTFHDDMHQEDDLHIDVKSDMYYLRKAQRTKNVKGVVVRSGRTVRAAEVKMDTLHATQGITEYGRVYVYSYPNNNRYSDKSTEQAIGKATCCGHSHICGLLLESIVKRRGRNIRVEEFEHEEFDC